MQNAASRSLSTKFCSACSLSIFVVVILGFATLSSIQDCTRLFHKRVSNDHLRFGVLERQTPVNLTHPCDQADHGLYIQNTERSGTHIKFSASAFKDIRSIRSRPLNFETQL